VAIAVKKSLLTAFLVTMIICGFAFVDSANISIAQTSTSVSGIISTNTAWTKANSPYSLTGPVAINKGVTLTIDSGVAVDLKGFYIQANGTLSARGSNSDRIYLNGGSIFFTSVSTSWNEYTGSGSIIDNANIDAKIDIDKCSPKIDYNIISGHIDCHQSSSVISNNNITGTEYASVIFVGMSSAIISNNTIHSKLTAIECLSDTSLVTNNTIYGGATGIISARGVISKNSVYDCEVGIDAQSFSTIEKNLLINNGKGILNRGTTIQNNTIINNAIGIYSQAPSTIIYNNIQNNSEYNIRLDSYARENLNATYNWWGTTDMVLIGNSIYDSKNDFNLGTVNFLPSLTEPNPQAVPDSNQSIPTPSQIPTQSPSITPTLSIPELSYCTVVILAILTTMAIFVSLKRKANIFVNTSF
jgi:hypothetical protein